MIWNSEQGFVSVLTVFSPGMQVQQKLIPPSKSSTYTWLRCHPWQIRTDTRVIAATKVMKQQLVTASSCATAPLPPFTSLKSFPPSHSNCKITGRLLSCVALNTERGRKRTLAWPGCTSQTTITAKSSMSFLFLFKALYSIDPTFSTPSQYKTSNVAAVSSAYYCVINPTVQLRVL